MKLEFEIELEDYIKLRDILKYLNECDLEIMGDELDTEVREAFTIIDGLLYKEKK